MFEVSSSDRVCVIVSNFFEGDSENSDYSQGESGNEIMSYSKSNRTMQSLIGVNEVRKVARDCGVGSNDSRHKVEDASDLEVMVESKQKGSEDILEEYLVDEEEEDVLTESYEYSNGGNQDINKRGSKYVDKIGGRVSERRREKVVGYYSDATGDAGGIVTLKRKDPYGKLYVARSRFIPGQYGAFLNERVEPNTELAVYSWTSLTAKEAEEAEDKTFIFNATEKVNGQDVEM